MFIDNLALIEAMIAFAAVVLTYVGVTTWWAIRRNEPEKVRAALKGGAIPIGSVGFAATVLGLWSEMVWPFPSTMAGYNILFDDVALMFGLVMMAFAASAYLGLRLQYVGLFAFAAGAATILYGWTGYGFNYTKEPFDFLLLYLGFGAAGLMTWPATVLVDYYLGTVSTNPTLWRSSSSASVGLRSLGVRGAMRLGRSKGNGETESDLPLRYRVPAFAHLLMLAFPVFMALAAIAAFWFFGTTLPGHLTPGKTP